MMKRLLFVVVVGAVLAAAVSMSSRAQTFVGMATKSLVALSNTDVSIKGSGGNLGWLDCYNPNAAVTYLQLFDSATSVTVGTDAPKFALELGATSGRTMQVPATFFSGIRVAATTTPTGGTAPGSAVNCAAGFQ